MAVTNWDETVIDKLEGLVAQAGGTLPTKGSVSNRQEYTLDLIDSLTTALIASSAKPSTASSTGTPGQLAYDASYIYICIATNTWERVAIATW